MRAMKLDAEVRSQAAHYIDSTLSRALLIKHLLGHQYGVMFRRLQELFMETGMPQRSQEDHERLVAAIEARDPAAARQAMEVHLDHVLRVFFAE